MGITRKDIVILTVLFNILVFTCILATAHQITTLEHLPSSPVSKMKEDVSVPAVTVSEQPVVFDDEIDQLLGDYVTQESRLPERSERDEGFQRHAVPQHTKHVAKETIVETKKPSQRWYVVQQGDNPWTIAKKFHIPFEKLLSLNNLDERSARRLKIGQTLRVREDP